MAAVPAPASLPAAYDQDGWHFKVSVQPLWGSDRIDDLAREAKLCKVPDMYSGDSVFRVHHRPSGLLLELSAADALRCCSWQPPAPVSLQPQAQDGTADSPSESIFGTVRCQFADKWRPNTANPDVKELEVTSDWTCSSPYWGSLYHISEGGERSLLETAGQETEEELPMDLLRRRDEIRWYNEVLFWEDELGDNGLCRMIVRARVMPTFWFVLQSCELRVDGVVIREVGTRFFFRFGSDHILREWTWKEASYDSLRSRGVELRDNPHISQTSIGAALLGPEDIRRRERHLLPLPCSRGCGSSQN